MMMANIPIKKINEARRLNIPMWLSNPDIVAPCPCGDPLLHGQPYLVAESELGMRRWFHGNCWNQMHGGGFEVSDEND